MADLGLSYLLDKMPRMVNSVDYISFYRDDGMVIFDADIDVDYITGWVGRFQQKVDTLTGASGD